ncbi:hypothetical protein OOK31_32660 [Streptomyces sp. NBC_00249]|uniref:hypothetical protein n=1 Tax=Streptomyces sp. NBC_00249 TaxID=2975690 RepID=UPI00225591A4|nr:hypothetical protein [Streptomyces sp. NBC_00249]MCX5198586.1 hypothetical protein [Streptomyces sp. NBC_00249]
MSPRKTLAMMTATAALIAGSVLTAHASTAAESQQSTASSASTSAFTGQAIGAGLTGRQATQLQQRVDDVLAKDPQARQVSANKLTTAGGTLVLAAPGQTDTRDLAAPGTALACANGHLCITDGRGNNYDYYRCGYYDFYGIGDGTFNNNQTSGTRARFYNENGTERWSNVAKSTGTASWTPVFHIRPC